MNRRPTPETDAFFSRTDIDWNMEVDFSRNLENERDAERTLADRLHGVLDSVDFRLAFVEDKVNGSISEDITKMRSIIFPALNAWKESRDLQSSQSPTITK